MRGVVTSLGKVGCGTDGGWGFEEDDDEPDNGPVNEELLTGADADGIVTVTVDDAADVRAVRLGDGWQGNEVRRQGVGRPPRILPVLSPRSGRWCSTPTI
jgi:hypothetical protein